MRKIAWGFMAAIVATLAQPALACRGPFSHRYVILEEPPARLPRGAELLAVTVRSETLVGSFGEVEPVDARITGAKDKRLVGKRVTIRPGIFSSCGRWSESDRANHVVGFLRREGQRLIIVPVVYRSKQYRTFDEDHSVGVKPVHFKKMK